MASLCGKLEKITESEFDEEAARYVAKIENELTRIEEALTIESGKLAIEIRNVAAISMVPIRENFILSPAGCSAEYTHVKAGGIARSLLCRLDTAKSSAGLLGVVSDR